MKTNTKAKLINSTAGSLTGKLFANATRPAEKTRSKLGRAVAGPIAAALVVAALLAPPVVRATTYTWTQTAAGTSYAWNTSANWGGSGFPNAIGDVANLNNNLAGTQTISLNQGITVGTLNIGDSASTYYAFTLQNGTGGGLTLNNSGAGAQINKTSASTAADTISANITLADNLAVALTTQPMTISGNITESGGAKTLTKSGAGMLTLSGTDSYSGGTIINTNVLLITSPTALGSGAVTVNNGGELAVWAASGGTLTNNLTLSGATLAGYNNNIGALGFRLPGQTLTLSGTVTLAADTQTSHYSSGGTVIFQNPIGGTGALTFYAGGNASSANQTWVLQGSASSYTGNTTIYGYFGANAIVQLQGGALPGTTALTLKDANQSSLHEDAVFDLNGYNQTLAGLTDVATSGGGGRFVMNSSSTLSTLTVNNSTAYTYGGVIGLNSTTVNGQSAGSGNLALVKQGTGTLTLSGVNTYTGLTTVSAGELKFSTAGSATTTVTVAAGATNGVLVASADSQWVNTGNLTNQAGSALHFDYGSTAPSTTTAPIYVANFVTASNLKLIVSGSPTAFTVGQSYPLVSWTGNGPGDASAFTAVVMPFRTSGNLSVSGSTLYLNFTGSSEPLTWNTGNGPWDTTSTGIWVDNALAPQTYVDEVDAVMFDDASGATGNPTVTLNSVLSPTAVTMKSTSHNYTLSGTGGIGGGTSLTLDPANTRILTLATTNSYTGGTVVNGGTLNLTGTITNSSVTVTNNAVFSESSSGVIAGPVTFTHASSGTSTLAGANTYTGTTTVSAGELDITNWSASASGSITVAGATNPTLGISGTATNELSTAAAIFVSDLNGNGTINQTGDTVIITLNSPGALLLGNGENASVGTYNLSGGTLAATFSAPGRGVMLGVNNNCSGVFNLSGTGNLSMPGAELAVGRNDAASSGCTATFNQTGGTAMVGYLSVGGQSGSTSTTATFSLTGGTFSASSFQNFVASGDSSATITLGGSAQVTLPAFPVPGGTANLTFDFTSGWLSPSAASTSYMNGLTAANLTTNGANFNVASGNDITVGQSFQDAPGGPGRLTKTGAGTLTLAGYNTYTGLTTVSNGALGFNGGSLSGPVVVNDGGGLSLLGSGTVPSVQFANTGSLSFNVVAGGVLTVAADNSLTNSGAAGSITINITGTMPAPGTYTLIYYSGSLQGSGFNAYQLGSLPAGVSCALVNTPGAVQLFVPSQLTWTGAQSSEWSTNTISPLQNWTWLGVPSDYTNGLNVLFDDSVGAGSTTVDISVADVTPAGVLFNNSGYNYTVSGSAAIAGTASLAMNGYAQLTILNTNTYSGPSALNNGTLQLGDGTSGHDGVIANSPSLVNNGTLVYNRFGSSAYGGVISGSGTVTMIGTGTQTLSGANTYTGLTTVSSGELDINNWGAGSIGGINVLSGAGQAATLGLSGSVTYNFGATPLRVGTMAIGTNTVNQTGGTVLFTGSTCLVLGNGNNPGTATYNLSGGTLTNNFSTTDYGVLMGAGDNSSATFNLSGGNLNFPAGTLAVGRNAEATANTTVAFYQTGGTASVGNLSVGGGQVTSAANIATFSLTGGSFRAANFPALALGVGCSATMILGGAAQVTLPAFPTTLGSGSSATLTLDFTSGWLAPLAASQTYISGLTAAYLTTNGARFNVAANNSITVAQVLQDAPAQTGGVLQKIGVGVLTLSGANTYSGNTTINAGTLLAMNTTGSGTGTGAVIINTNATLGGTGTIAGTVTNNAGGTLAPGASGIGTLTLSGNVVLAANSTNTFEVNGSTPANDLIVLGGAVMYGGVLNIVPSGTFTNGQTFTLFSGAGAASASNFASIAGSPGAGQAFSFTNGVLSVVGTGPSGPALLTGHVSGGVLSLSWLAGQGWRLQMQTNTLLVGLNTNWIYLTDGTLSSTNIMTSPTNPAVFYRLIYP